MKLSERKIFLIFLSLVAGVICVYYGPFLDNYFAYDDFGLMELVSRGPKSIMLGYNYTLRFVNNAVWIPLFTCFGFNPVGYNLFGTLLWFLNAILLYRFLLKLLGTPVPAAIAGFIFTASAVGADALLWRAASGTLLNVTFYLLTLYYYTVFRQSGAVRAWRISVCCFILAMFSKEEAASLPLVVILIEWLYLGGLADFRGVARRCLIFCSVIIFSVLINYIVIYKVMQVQSELAHMFKFRPLHSLFSSWTVFFLSPEGILNSGNPGIYITALLIPLSLILIKDRRLLLLGLGWIFLSFLPQSLSGMSQFNPNDVISVSLSRHLYLPSAGAAIAYTALLISVRERFPLLITIIVSAFFLVSFTVYNYGQLSVRGKQWHEIGDPMKRFLTNIKKLAPQFAPNTKIFVINTPTGRAFIQQALRVFYNNPSITYIVDINNFRPKPEENAVLITCSLTPDGDVRVQMSPIQ